MSIEFVHGFNRTDLTWRLKKGQSVDLPHGRRQIVEAKRDVEFSTNLEVKPSLTYLSAIKLNFSTYSFGIMETWLREYICVSTRANRSNKPASRHVFSERRIEFDF